MATPSMSGLDLHLELGSVSGRRAALEQALRAAVREGRLAPHTRLPSTRSLADELGISRGTVSAAYDQLIAEGYLVARRGSGTAVAELPSLVEAAHGRPALVGPRSAEQARARTAGAPGTGGLAVRGLAGGSLPGGGTHPGTPPAPGRAGPLTARELQEPRGAPPRYDLRPGRPDVTGFPVTAWLNATRRALARAPVSAYDYGDPRGRIELRSALAGYLGRTRGVVTSVDRIVVTSGAVQALALLADVLRAVEGGCFAMEDPGLAFHREVVARRGVRPIPLPVDDGGARVSTLVEGSDALCAVVLTPAHQYPTGVVLQPERRRQVVEWARDRDAIVIEDDYDGEFRYDRQSVGALQGTAPEHVVYLGTASKTLGPGLRLGWLVLPEHLVEPMVEAKRHADLQTETINQLALAEMITSHAYDRHVRLRRQDYRRRRNLLVERLGPAVAAGYRVHGIAAGLHGRVDLPLRGPEEEEVLAVAASRGLAVGGMSSHWFDPQGRPQGLVVGFGTPGASAFPAALDTLVRTLREVTVRRPQAR